MGKEDYVSYAKSYYGASVLLHGAERFPQTLDKIIVAQPGSDVNIAVIPSVVVSQDNIRDVPIQQRNCYFNDEVCGLKLCSIFDQTKPPPLFQRNLRSTKKYSYQACVSECAADNVVRVCECVPFYYPEIRKFWEFVSK